MIAVLVAFAASAWTVSFTNPNHWSTVYVHAWDDGGGNYTGGSWPGKVMTKSGDVWTYTGTGSGAPTKIIFNNGSGAQTDDLKFYDNSTYDMNGVVGAVITYANIYVPVSEYNKSTCYIYSWEPGIFGNPGTKMEKETVDGTEYWVAKVNADNLPATVGGWLLHNGSWGDKTGDLPSVEFKENYVYYTNGKSTELGSEPDPTPVDANVFLAGEFNGWNGADSGYKFTKGDDGLYTLSVPSLSGYFKVVCNNEWLGTTTPVESGVEYTLSDIGYENMKLASELGNDVTLKFNADSKTLVATYTPATEPAPDALYVIGTLVGDGNQWNPSYGIALTKDGDSFSGKIEIGTAYENEYGFFSLCTQLGANSDDWNVGTRYGADANEDVLALPGETYAFAKAGDPKAWKVSPATYNINVDFTDYTITLTQLSTGVETIEMDEAAAPVYYNLQGIRVAEPKSGLHIVVRGNKVAKEFVR